MSCRAQLMGAVAIALLLGCGSDRAVSAQSTSTLASKSAASPVAGLISPTARPSVSPAAGASPGVAASSGSARSASLRSQLGPGSPAIDLQLVTNALDQPLQVTHAGDGSGRLFVVEKKGRIVLLQGGTASTYLDISTVVGSRASEQGLLGLAFHPSHRTNGLFYVNYTDREGDTVVERYSASSANPNVADPGSKFTLLNIDQPADNHNGGMLAFGPDGHLFIGMGDGGRAGDPWGNAQNRSVLLGKMLRLDVNNGSPYGIPGDNPFVGDPSARPEIWAYGLRNPWRYSFDRATGDLYIADVGQNQWEWVHLQRAGVGGQNYGWNLVEGSHCYPANRSCDPSSSIQPIAEYDHSLGCSITGGHVYRGAAFPHLSGLYFYGDYCSGRVWAAQQQPAGGWMQQELLDSQLRISSFGEDEAGEIYLTSFGDNGLYRLVSSS